MDERPAVLKRKRKPAALPTGQPVAVQLKKPKVIRKKVTPARQNRVKAVSSVAAKTPISVPEAKPARFERAITLLSPYRFPMAIERHVISTARIGGVAFVILGALGTLMYMSLLFGDGRISQSAQLLSSSTLTTSSPTLQPANTLTAAVQNSITISQTPPLKGTATVTIVAPRARKVDLYLFEQSWQNKSLLGSAKQVGIDTWEYRWDTTNVQSGLDYRITAYVYEQSTTNAPDYTLQLGYMRVDNVVQAATSTAGTATTTVVDHTPPVTLQAPAILSGLSDIVVNVIDATSVSLSVEHVASGSRNLLYDAKQVQPGKWLVSWPTANFSDGDYQVRARVKNQYGAYTDGAITVTVQNGSTQTVNTATTSAPVTKSVTTQPVALPAITIDVNDGSVFSDTEPIEIDVENGSVDQLYLYVRDSVSTFPRFIGAAIKRTDAAWYFNWFTRNTPNGRYILFALAATPQGQVQSQQVPITVDNTVIAAPTPTAEQEVKESIVEASQAIVADATVQQPPEVVAPAPTTEVDDAAALARQLFLAHQSDFEAELARLGTALRSENQTMSERVIERIDALTTEILEQRATAMPVETAFRTLVETRIATYTAEVTRVSALIAERQRADLLLDTDKDSISDFDEVTLFNTDPLVADTDNDGFVDGAEILSGFDPLSDARESVLTYESPKEAGVYREDILSIDTIAAAAIETASTSQSAAGILLRGKALPNSFVTLYLYSTPIIVTIKTDAEGAWEYRFEQELEDGAHNVYVGITDNAGRVVAKSQPRAFIKEAEAITPVEAAALDTVVIEPQESSLVSSYVLYAIASISVVAIGLILILLGLHLDNRRRVVASEGVPAV